jgi:hypothetical protein
MISYEHNGFRLCDGITRREFLRVGGLSALGLTFADFLRASHAQNPKPKTQNPDVSCILLWMMGGPSHIDTFDLKPDASSEIRGQFKPIKTNVPGVEICEHLPNLAKRMDRVALIRSITHPDATHGSASHAMFTGQMKPPGVFEYPNYGATLTKLAGIDKPLPPAVTMPYYLKDAPVPVTGQEAGFLGKEFDPFFLLADPNAPNFNVPNLRPPSNVTSVGVNSRRSLLQSLDEKLRHLENNETLRLHDAYYQRAYAMMTSPAAKKAFALREEPAKLRDAYGRTTFGQSCLLARRLVQAGVRFVQVNFIDNPGNFANSFDTHGDNFTKLKNVLLPRLEPAYCALLDDLTNTGLIDNTLVVLMGEFGRTPKISGAGDSGGRDHWPGCSFALFAGAGIRTAQVIGESDNIGAYPQTRPVSPADIAATIYRILGVPTTTEFLAPDGRPLRMVTGEVIAELLA